MVCLLQLEAGENTYIHFPVVALLETGTINVKFSALSFYDRDNDEVTIDVSVSHTPSGLILGLRPANERRRYFVTTSFIGWVQAENQPCTMVKFHGDIFHITGSPADRRRLWVLGMNTKFHHFKNCGVVNYPCISNFHRVRPNCLWN